MVQAKDASAQSLAKTSFGKAAEIERLIAPSLEAMGYDIVRILLSSHRRARLQIMVERRDQSAVGLEDCAEVSRTVGALLEVGDPIQGPYDLEVSSPGIDRPLTRLDDFSRFAGYEARVEIGTPIDGRRRWRGRLLGVDGDRVRLATDQGEIDLPFAGIDKAKLVLTDDLLGGMRETSKR